jgi:hypothetical protein
MTRLKVTTIIVTPVGSAFQDRLGFLAEAKTHAPPNAKNIQNKIPIGKMMNI